VKNVLVIGVGLWVAVLCCVPAHTYADDTTAPTIEHTQILDAPLYEPIIFRVQINDESMIFAPSLYYRYAGQTEYRMLQMEETARAYVAKIDGSEITGDIEYFLEAFDEHGNGPSRRGSPTQPIRIAVGKMTPSIPMLAPSPIRSSPSKKALPRAKPRLTPGPRLSSTAPALHTRWWFWASMTVALVAGGTAAAWALKPDDTDSVRIRVIGPDPYKGLP
jgi:hypothetical protein